MNSLISKMIHRLRQYYHYEDIQEKASDFSLLLGYAVILLIFSVNLFVSISFALGFSVSWVHLLIGSCVGVIVVWWIIKKSGHKKRLKHFLAVLVCLVVLFVGSIGFSGAFFDLSWDGQSYHQEAVIQLSQGWNPFTDTVSPEQTNHSVELNHWAKGPWLFEAALYKCTHSIEQGKALNILLLFASLFLSFSAFLSFRKISFKAAVVLAVVLSFNPVVLSQCLSFYVDGQLSSLLVSLVSTLVLVRRRQDKMILSLLFFIIVLAVNTKFTGIPYTGIFTTGFLVWLLIHGKYRSFTHVICVSAMGFILGVTFFGYNPYLTNLFRQGHPFYPMAGPNAFYFNVLLEDQMPQNFYDMNRLEKLFTSVFSKSENTVTPAASTFKVPFSISKEELQTFRDIYDTRVAGWGPLFGGALIITLFIMLIALVRNRIYAGTACFMILWVLASVVVNSESWWARFAPHLWFVPIIGVVLALYLPGKMPKIFGMILLITLATNIILIAGLNGYGNITRSQKAKHQIVQLAETRETIVAYFYWFRSNRIRFQEYGIRFREVGKEEDLPCPDPEYLVGSLTRFCIEDIPNPDYQ